MINKALLFSIAVIGTVVYAIYLTNVQLIKPVHQTFSARVMPRINLSDLLSSKHNSSFLISPFPSCVATELTLIVVVCSAPENFAARQAIRSTWGDARQFTKPVKVVFLIGRSPDILSDNFINDEKMDHVDIIHYDFLDTYFNLTIKSFILLEWVYRLCNKTSYIMKVDDDTFVNIPLLLELLNRLGSSRLLLGHLMKNAAPVKDLTSKWYVPKTVYPRSYYPNYLSGSGYIMSADIIQPLRRTALKVPFLHLEDIFITGICAEKSGIVPRHDKAFSYVKPRLEPCIFQKLVTAHRLIPKEQMTVWKDLHKPFLKCMSSYELFRRFFWHQTVS